MFFVYPLSIFSDVIMKILIIYAHPKTGSFNSAIRDAIINTSNDCGHEVEARDLYVLNFDPVLTAQELDGTFNGIQANDVLLEQNYITWADKIVFIYPLWWGSMPAILRGYLDRVLSYGFAYCSGTDSSVGLLTNKSIVIINTIGSKELNYHQNGMLSALETIASHGIFNFCGANIEKYFHFCNIHNTELEERLGMLEQVKAYFSSLSR